MIRSRRCKWNNPTLWVIACLMCTRAGHGLALELGENVQMHGFVSQALVHTTENRMGGGSDDGIGADLRELGLNLSWRPDPQWLVSAQALSRWAGATDDGSPRLDYGFADRTLYADALNQVGLSVGKVKNPLGFFNSTRDVAHTRPGVIMPQSIYLDRIRNFYLAAPGLSLHGLHAFDEMEINWSLNYMRPEANDVDLEHLFLLGNRAGHYEGRPSWLGQAMFDVDGGRWRYGLTLGEVGIQYRRGGGADPVQAGRSDLATWTLSVQRNSERWSLTAEYSQTRNEGSGYGAALPPGIQEPNTVENWYAQGLWRLTPDWSVYTRRDVFYLDKDDPQGLSLALLGMPGHLAYGKGWTLGLRHDLGAWSVWAEWSRNQGTVWLSPQEIPLAQQKKDWDALLLQAAWRF